MNYPQIQFPKAFAEIASKVGSVKDVFKLDTPRRKQPTGVAFIGIPFLSWVASCITVALISLIFKSIISPILSLLDNSEPYLLSDKVYWPACVVVSLSYCFLGFLIRAKDYERLEAKHLEAELFYKKKQEEAKSSHHQLIYRKKIFTEVTSMRNFFCTTSTAPVGTSERQFYAYALQLLEPKILAGLTRGNSVNFGDRFGNYTPDLIYSDKELKFNICIEIDEPYVFNTGEPIHYVLGDGKTSDQERDDYFLSKNWVVVRFSEMQIVLRPKQCLDYLSALIRKITNLEFEEPERTLGFLSQSRWTRENALLQRSLGARKWYLDPLVILDYNLKNQVDTDLDDWL